MKEHVLEALLNLGFPYKTIDSNTFVFDYADTRICYEYDEESPRFLVFNLYGVFMNHSCSAEMQLDLMNEINGIYRYVKLFKTGEAYSLSYQRKCSYEEIGQPLEDIIDHMLNFLISARYKVYDCLDKFRSDNGGGDETEEESKEETQNESVDFSKQTKNECA